MLSMRPNREYVVEQWNELGLFRSINHTHSSAAPKIISLSQKPSEEIAGRLAGTNGSYSPCYPLPAAQGLAATGGNEHMQLTQIELATRIHVLTLMQPLENCPV